VSPFSEKLGRATDVPIVDVAVAYDCPFTFNTYVLIARKKT
jgi:hypothetical protein